MPLDGHSYLVSHGWTGKGTGLRQGAISRPLAIPQKKNLAGLGKDRDEAFPFWDHLFSAAAKSIQLKVTSDDESDAESSTPEFKRTATGILSNRRPVTGVSATTSGTSTPSVGDEVPKSNLLSIAKREAAKSSLYARFFRGPVLGSGDDSASTRPLLVAEVDAGQRVESGGKQEHDREEVQTLHKKRKREVEDDAERLQRKKERKERKEQKAKRKEERKARRRDRKAVEAVGEELNTEKMKREERKRQKRVLKEAKEVRQQDDDVILKKGKKEKKDTAPRIQEQTVPLLDGHPQARARGHRPQPPEHDSEEGNKKKKRKQQ